MSLIPDNYLCDNCCRPIMGGGAAFCSDECREADAEFRRDPAAAMAKTEAACAANLERMRSKS